MAVPATEFIVKQITQPRFVLLVEETGNMNLRVRHSLCYIKDSNVAYCQVYCTVQYRVFRSNSSEPRVCEHRVYTG